MVHQVTWYDFGFAIAISAFGFYIVLTTKLGERRTPSDPWGSAYSLKLFAKGGGWMFAIGGILGALRILSMLVNQ